VSDLLRVEELAVTFAVRSRRLRRQRLRVRAVDGVSLTVAPGETLAVVGESGSGKSTVARAILRLVRPDAGTVWLDGADVSRYSDRAFRKVRASVQMVFQDPYSSLDPSMTVADSVAEPLEVHTNLTRAARQRRVAELFDLVGLAGHHLHRYPYEFSGGQRQRIAIARAIAVDPRLVICDEAVSALDVSTQNQIINLLGDLRTRLGIAYLFISHDLAVVRNLADRVAVMYLGRIVEEGPVARVFGAPAHPYTKALLTAVPVANPARQRQRERVPLLGEVPDATNPPTGCAFHPRCPYALPVCATDRPAPVAVPGGGLAACHLLDQPTDMPPG
jgi:peptide/nickel transport system ATP-binding protein